MHRKTTLAAVLAFAALLSSNSLLRADVVTDWNTITLTTLTAAGVLRVPPATRTLAMVPAAVYDAVNSIDHRYSPYLIHERAPRNTSPEAAAVLAAYTVLVGLYPTQKASLDSALASSLSGVPDGLAKSLGVAWGTSIGIRVLAVRNNDGSAVQATYDQPPADDGIPFTVTTSYGVPRSYLRFSQAAEENGNACVYVGFHFRSAVVRGMHQGKDVGAWVYDNFLTDDDEH